MYRPIKAIINAAALCFQENVKCNNDKQTAGIKNGAHRSKSGIVLSEMCVLSVMPCFQALLSADRVPLRPPTLHSTSIILLQILLE